MNSHQKLKECWRYEVQIRVTPPDYSS